MNDKKDSPYEDFRENISGKENSQGKVLRQTRKTQVTKILEAFVSHREVNCG